MQKYEILALLLKITLLLIDLFGIAKGVYEGVLHKIPRNFLAIFIGKPSLYLALKGIDLTVYLNTWRDNKNNPPLQFV